MEGLLIAEQLGVLAGSLPAERLAWSFPDQHTAVLPLRDGFSVVIRSKPDDASILVTRDPLARAPAITAFQRQLASRATGDLGTAEQRALDRVVFLGFSPSRGFVPEPAVTLVAELTGRNANLVLLDEAGTIVGVERAVTSERNRFRELRPGVAYVPPPPYDKLDPRRATEQDLRDRLLGLELRKVRSVVDGVGPRLQAAIEERVRDRTGEAPTSRLAGSVLEATVAVIREVARAPSQAAGSVVSVRGSRADRSGGRRAGLEREATSVVAADLKLARRRLADARRALEPDGEPARLRSEADLLLATGSSWEVDGSRAKLRGLDGEPVELEIDPRRDAAGNADLRYDRARRREGRRERAAAQLPQLEAEVARLEELERTLPDLGEADLAALVKESQRSRKGGPDTGRSKHEVGVRFNDPRGFEVIVGRNARENDAVTFKVARSRDIWLHAQGYRGAHVVVRSGGREVPFDSVLFAARLAAGFSEARSSGNVPVDYTERKNVWRVKGAAPGAVNYSHQKTVYVDPARDDAGAAGEE